MLSAISADEYKQKKKMVELDSASRTFGSREFENVMQKILRRFSKVSESVSKKCINMQFFAVFLSCEIVITPQGYCACQLVLSGYTGY